MTDATYHLWLKPNGDARISLTEAILELSLELGSPPFEPHVTLLANLKGTETEHLKKSKLLANTLQPFEIVLTEASYGDSYFQCLFMFVQQTPVLMRAHALARSIFESAETPYMPHLSLVYGSYPPAKKREIIQNLPEHLSTSFTTTNLFLIRANSGDPKDWHEVSSCPFTR